MEYTNSVQQLFLEFIIQDPELFVRISNIYNPENFNKGLRKVASLIKDHSQEHDTLPDKSQIKAITGFDLQEIPDLNSGHIDWFMDEFEKFTKRQELERAILKAADLLEKGDYGPVEKLITDAVQISLTRDLGTDYFADPKARLLQIRSQNGQFSTGWKQLDEAIFGGFNRKELEVIMGVSGSGKSLVLGNLAVNWILANLNGFIITLELSEELCAMRLDAMMISKSTKELYKDLDDTELKIKMLGKRCGQLCIKYLPTQSTTNDIRAYIKEIQIKTGMKPDFVIVDYLDLMMPSTAKINMENVFIKDKIVSEELRNLANELNIVIVSASQIGRQGTDEVEFGVSDISGGVSKIFTSDNILAIYTSRSMRERGKYQLQLVKTRNSTGVNKKIDLDYDVNTMRITDNGPSGDDNSATPAATNIMSQIKNKSRAITTESINNNLGKVQTEVKGNKLKEMLAGLKKHSD